MFPDTGVSWSHGRNSQLTRNEEGVGERRNEVSATSQPILNENSFFPELDKNLEGEQYLLITNEESEQALNQHFDGEEEEEEGCIWLFCSRLSANDTLLEWSMVISWDFTHC